MAPVLISEKIQSSPSPGTDRAFAILELISETPEGISVAEITRKLGISQNSVFRITLTLQNRGYLFRNEKNKCYTLTSKLFDLIRPRVNEKSLTVCAYESLCKLSKLTGETTQLLVKSGEKVIVLEQVAGTHPVKVMGEVGLRIPLYSCAPGKAILAWLPEDELKKWLSQVRLKKFTTTTLSNRKSLLKDLAATRDRGYSVDFAEGLEGIHCVGSPVFNSRQYPVAAITLMAPLFRLPEEKMTELGQECRKVALEIQERLFA